VIELLEEMVRDRFGKKGEIIVARTSKRSKPGYDYVDKHPFKKTSLNSPPSRRHSNASLCPGMKRFHRRYLRGLPLLWRLSHHPASDILGIYGKDLPKFGGAVVQTEDEISAIASVVGASYAGKKAMSATSGPGLSLIGGNLGPGLHVRNPVRDRRCAARGPTPAMPTKMEPRDLNLAVFAAHGDAPRIVLAPGDVEECLSTIMHAFNLSEKYQCPVIYLTDQSLAHRTQTFPWPTSRRCRSLTARIPTDKDLKDGYIRFKAEKMVFADAIPGWKAGCYPRRPGASERGAPTLRPRCIIKMFRQARAQD